LSLLYELDFGGGLKWWKPSWKGLSFSILRRVDMEVYHSYTYVDHILIEILFSRPIDVLQIFELLFHGHICYECLMDYSIICANIIYYHDMLVYLGC
jgi:hypothetical protein